MKTEGNGSTALLKKNVGLIHSSGIVRLLDKKVYHVLLRNAYDSLLTAECHFLPISLIHEALGFSGNNYEVIKESIQRLREIKIEFDVLNQMKSHLAKIGEDLRSELGIGEWHSLSLISEASIDNNTVCYEFSSTMKNVLYNPHMYVLVDVNLSKIFKSSYAYSLYEIALRTARVASTGWIDIDDFRLIMGVPIGRYAKYSDFKRKVILVAEKEITSHYDNGYVDFTVCLEEKRVNKRVSQVKVTVLYRNKKPDVCSVNVAHGGFTDEQKDVIKTLTTRYRMHIKQASMLVSGFSVDHILSQIRFTDIASKKRSFKHSELAGFLAAAIKDNLPKNKTNDNPKKYEDSKNSISVADVKKSSANDDVYQMCEIFLRSLCDKKRLNLINAMIRHGSTDGSSIVMLMTYRDHGKEEGFVIKQLLREPWLSVVNNKSSLDDLVNYRR